jgi:hypothetical protein
MAMRRTIDIVIVDPALSTNPVPRENHETVTRIAGDTWVISLLAAMNSATSSPFAMVSHVPTT